MNIIAWIILISGIYMTGQVFFITARRFINTMLFKVIPFFLGLTCIVIALSLFDLMIIKIL